jgi:hypothetical protein
MPNIGRPSEYNESILAEATAYLDNFNTQHEHAIPSIAGLAKVLKKNRDTLYQWAKEEDKKDFSDILRQIVSDQEFTLLNKGLKGEFNPAITKLVLGKHGYHDKQETDITSGGKEIKNEWHIHPVTTRKDAKDKP